jgi:hypothetical protein
MTIARQLFGKHIPEVTLSTVEEPPLLGSKSLGTFHNNGKTVTEELFEMVIYILFASKL